MDGISCLWHAFDALDEKKIGRVSATTLRVLTHNIGTSLGLHDVEKSLPGGSEELLFDDYIASFKDSVPAVYLNAAGIKIVANVTWLLCEKSVSRRGVALLGPDDVHKLWQVFHVICHADGEGRSYQPVVIDVEEVAFVVRQIRDRANDPSLFDYAASGDGTSAGHSVPLSSDQPTTVDFKDFLRHVEAVCVGAAEREVASVVIDELHQYYVLHKLKKGELIKSGDHVRNRKKRWFVLTTDALHYYVDRTEADLKGSILLEDVVKVETPVMEKRGTTKNVTLLINCGNRTYEIYCPDLKTRQSWQQALLEAIDSFMSVMPLPKKLFLQRQRLRCERRSRELEEMQRRLAEDSAMKQTLSDLKADKLRAEQERQELEALLQAEAALRLADERRLQELEELQRQLERLLIEERQAKRDEEIVRALQARMLDEEMQKREYLEQLHYEQEALLLQERRTREALLLDQQRLAAAIEEERQRRQDVEQQKQLKEEEGRAAQELLERERVERERLANANRLRHEELERLRMQQQELLAAERVKLQQLEDGRRLADEQLQMAVLKLQEAERAKRVLEERAKLHQMQQTIGLRRPIQPSAHPLITHRGQGAFTDTEFEIRRVQRLKEKGGDGGTEDDGTEGGGGSSSTGLGGGGCSALDEGLAPAAAVACSSLPSPGPACSKVELATADCAAEAALDERLPHEAEGGTDRDGRIAGSSAEGFKMLRCDEAS